MTRFGSILALSALVACCAGKEVQVGALVATAATLKTIQSVRAKSLDAQPVAIDCLVYCDSCTFPCGNQCVPNGTFCYEPPGHACWQGGKQSRQAVTAASERCTTHYQFPIDPLIE